MINDLEALQAFCLHTLIGSSRRTQSSEIFVDRNLYKDLWKFLYKSCDFRELSMSIESVRLSRAPSFQCASVSLIDGQKTRGSFVGIAMERLLPSASTTSKTCILSPPCGVTHISIVASADTMLPYRQKISNWSSTSKGGCETTTLLIVNSVK
jgi:hypothetical protein